MRCDWLLQQLLLLCCTRCKLECFAFRENSCDEQATRKPEQGRNTVGQRHPVTVGGYALWVWNAFRLWALIRSSLSRAVATSISSNFWGRLLQTHPMNSSKALELYCCAAVDTNRKQQNKTGKPKRPKKKIRRCA